MANPRVEEVDDASDPDEMDLDAFDFARPGQSNLQSSSSSAEPQMDPNMLQQMMGQMGGGGGGMDPNMLQQMMGQMGGGGGGMDPNMLQQMMSQMGGAGGGMPQMQGNEKERLQREQQSRERTKKYQCVYPIYFDASRSREDGRRVRKEDAVSNPLAKTILDALQYIGHSKNVPLDVVLEVSKTHPKDWANPGRVRVLVKRDGKPVSGKIGNKHHLYKLIAEYLKEHPTTEDSPDKLQLRGMPPMSERIPPAVPRGFKIGSILPLHSPALSGGGVSDNMMADMMKELGGAGGMPEGMAGPASGGGAQKKAKDKKKK